MPIVDSRLPTANCELLTVLQFCILPLVLCFGFVEEQFGEDALVGHGKDIAPFGNIAAGQGVYGVYIPKLFESVYASPFFKSCSS